MASQRIPFVFGSIPARFESDFSLEESLDRLQSAVSTSVFHAMTEQAMVGTVSVSRVSLRRDIPLVGNSFKPFFRGSFHEAGKCVALEGRFTVLPIIKLFLALCLVFAAVFVAIACVAVFRGDPDGVSKFRFSLLMVLAFVFITFFGQWFARNDIDWLSRRIASALANKDSRGAI
jgi:hypothetical protein